MPSDQITQDPAQVSLQAVIAARRYFYDGKQKSAIAEELGVSRFKVARLLDEARASGIVKITIESPAEIDLGLGEALAKEYGVRHVFVAKVSDRWLESAKFQVASAAAKYIMDSVSAEDVLGISWGTSVTEVVDKITILPKAPVVQLVGGVRSSKLNTNGAELLRRLSLKGGGEAYPLMAPLVVESESMAKALRQEPAIIETLKQFSKVTMALVGIGSWKPQSSTLFKELSTQDRNDLTKSGAVSDVCGIVLDSEGQVIKSSFQKRTLAISSLELSRVNNVIAVASGIEKVEAVRSALKSGLLDVAVIDSILAQGLLGKP